MHATDLFVPYRPLREVPIYLHTTCLHCGADQGVAVRYRSSVLCLDCYRDAKRRERERRRRLRVLARRGGLASGGAGTARLRRLE